MKVPVTVLSGYLGSGKTTLLQQILQNEDKLKIAVIVNDMTEINIDARLIKENGLVQTDEKLVELQNGCICCTLREDLLLEVNNLVRQGDIDYIVIESSGISEPIPVAQTFTYMDEELGVNLSEKCRLDTMVTVVDTAHFWSNYSTGESLLDRQQGINEDDERDIVDLLVDQIEFANVIILNKVDLINTKRLQTIKGFIRKLNADADIICTAHSKVDINRVLNTNLFHFEKASQAAGWIKELNEEHIPETDEYNISSFLFKSRKPFHPERLMYWLENWPEGIVRAKGFFWLASRNDQVGLLSQAGSNITISGAGEWVATYSNDEQKKLLQEDSKLSREWDVLYGDRLTEIVFIGISISQKEIQESLELCVLTEEEMTEGWLSFHDPLPDFY
ncbi:GTP-binding protein [Alkalihalobacillus pseudalcaliphilus]|uniref:GTP-binding protein n=1 Tax=Alkalihalobacillus pseudalcaliphilus TaxID=79884 RepID=UPI00064DDFF2|nr:GTP-binding protein [Alkalihalobacillus pseudalcaliphilus]KMK76770.1 cobalamin biosynthesis protein CobW [Alkalihalobacillus pseudalcaliphilus]